MHSRIFAKSKTKQLAKKTLLFYTTDIIVLVCRCVTCICLHVHEADTTVDTVYKMSRFSPYQVVWLPSFLIIACLKGKSRLQMSLASAEKSLISSRQISTM